MTLQEAPNPQRIGTATGRRHSAGIPDFEARRDELLDQLADILDESRLQYAVNQLAVFDKAGLQRAAITWLERALEHPERVASPHTGRRYNCNCSGGSGWVLVDEDGQKTLAPCHRCNPVAFARFDTEHSYHGDHLRCPRPDNCPVCQKLMDPTNTTNQGWAV